MRRFLTFAAVALAFVQPGYCQEANHATPVVIDYFFEHGCADCTRVNTFVMPSLKEKYSGYYVIYEHDVNIMTNVPLLIAFQQKLQIKKNEPVMMVVDYKTVLNGFDEIKARLPEVIDEAVSLRQEPDWKPPAPITANPDDVSLANERLKTFTLSIILINGLIDGLNPCAFSTLVFFMSLLAVSKVRGRGLAAMGISFCLATFITYTALGFGLLHSIHLISGFAYARIAVKVIMTALLAALAFLSFRDAYRFKKTHNPDDVTLQLPASIKNLTHRIMKMGLGMGSLVFGGLIIGLTVTALESVCTGQAYIPTLVLLIQTKHSVSQAWTYLLLYNLMFVLPLIFIFLLTLLGLKFNTLLDWSRKEVVLSKALLGILFAVMAVLIAIT